MREAMPRHPAWTATTRSLDPRMSGTQSAVETASAIAEAEVATASASPAHPAPPA
jgi:hypothetical protein